MGGSHTWPASRDSIQTKGGTLWWAGQWGNNIGQINPERGEMKKFELPEVSKPQTVTLDSEGHVWYTSNKNGTVGRLNPTTGDITSFGMPNPNAKDPHWAIILW